MLKKRRLQFESLETRKVLAGNVLATVTNGELKITGDNSNNSVEIVSVPGLDGSGRTFRITGKPFSGVFAADGTPVNTGNVTRINGRNAAVDLFVSGLKVTIDTKGGNDAISLGGPATLRRFKTSGLTIDTGLGQDFVKITNGDDVSLNPVVISTANPNPALADLENDDETVLIDNFTARRSLKLSTGGGSDKVTINKFSVVNGTTTINTGTGRDNVRITRSDFDRFSLETGASDPFKSNLSDDRDVIYLAAVRADSASLAFGGGNDVLTLARIDTLGIEVAGRVTVNGGVGSDEIKGISNVTFVGSYVPISVETTS